jgi:hypothetical protein
VFSVRKRERGEDRDMMCIIDVKFLQVLASSLTLANSVEFIHKFAICNGARQIEMYNGVILNFLRINNRLILRLPCVASSYFFPFLFSSDSGANL